MAEGMRKKQLSKNSKISTEENCDWLSNLPETLLLHIISFLEIKAAIKMSFLSKRWRNLWTHSPKLIFIPKRLSNGGGDDYQNFINRSLLRYEASKVIKIKFSFTHEEKYTSDIDNWIFFAIRKQVQELELDLTGNCLGEDMSLGSSAKYNIPCWLFTSGSLTRLKLIFCVVRPPASMHLGSLKMLFLWNVELNNDSVRNLLAGCPLLQDLEMRQCCGLTILTTSNLQLKCLTICSCAFDGLEIWAPNLLSLDISGNISKCSYSLKNLSSLMDASLTFGYWNGYNTSRDGGIFEKFIVDLQQAKGLRLQLSCLEGLTTLVSKILPTPVSNRKCLMVDLLLRSPEEQGLAFLLRGSPELETLVINFPKHLTIGSDFELRDYWESQTTPFPCLMHHLKTLKVRNLVGRSWPCGFRNDKNRIYLKKMERKLNLVKFLMKNAIVLEKIIIYVTDDCSFNKSTSKLKVVLEFTQKVLAFPRASIAEVLIQYT